MTTANHGVSRIVVLLSGLILVTSLGLSTTIIQAFAMGQVPSTCNNRYDGPITAAKIIVGSKTYYPLAHPGLTFQLASNKAYTVQFTIQTPAKSSQGNSLPGTTWYSDSTFGYYNGHCVNNADPNQRITLTVSATHSASSPPPPFTQHVEFYTLVKYPGFDYNVRWTTQ
jgi:hypothetical protein